MLSLPALLKSHFGGRFRLPERLHLRKRGIRYELRPPPHSIRGHERTCRSSSRFVRVLDRPPDVSIAAEASRSNPNPQRSAPAPASRRGLERSTRRISETISARLVRNGQSTDSLP